MRVVTKKESVPGTFHCTESRGNGSDVRKHELSFVRVPSLRVTSTLLLGGRTSDSGVDAQGMCPVDLPRQAAGAHGLIDSDRHKSIGADRVTIGMLVEEEDEQSPTSTPEIRELCVQG